MASREKKPLAPSKAKQKANNDSGLPSNEIKCRKGKSLTNLKQQQQQQQLARDILEAVATGSQLPPKLEATLPHKKVLRNLKRKQKLRVAKANLIKSKVTKKVAGRNLCRITSDIKKGVRARRIKLSEENSVKQLDVNSKGADSQINSTEGEGVESVEGSNRSAKNNLRTKKTKLVPKSCEETENEDTQDRETDSIAGSSAKGSLKLGRKGRSLDISDSVARGAKSTKFTTLKRNSIKDKEICIKIEGDTKCTKGRKSQRDVEHNNARATSDIKFSKVLLDSKSSIDLTIDEVIASMLSDSDVDNQHMITEKIEGKVTRSRKMLVEDNTVPDIEIKKEPDSDDVKVISDGENADTDTTQSAIQLRKRSNISVGQRSLRNGKLRLSDSGISPDLELKKRRRLNSDDPVSSEVSTDNITDGNGDTESCFSESSGNDSQTAMVSAKDDPCLKQELLRNFEDGSQTDSEMENNNNSDRADRTSEIGPTLRSKTKAKSTEVEVKSDNIKIEYTRIVPKNTELQEEVKKASNLDQVRKDAILAKLSDKSKGRRSSLNIDMKKTVGSFYGTEKSDGNPKSQIDQMIENIKLTIAKSIESKIFGPEKGLGLSKNFEVPKIEEIIAPLSAESQKLGLEENTDEDKSAISKNEIKSDSSENSVPKVADTAKEIEKLVMGDIELAETHSQNVQQEREPQDTDANNSVHNAAEIANAMGDSGNNPAPSEQQEETKEVSDEAEETKKDKEDVTDNQTKSSEEGKKATPPRKSSRVTDKSPTESGEAPRKPGRPPNKVAQKSENCEKHSDEKKKNQSISKESVSEEAPLESESPLVSPSTTVPSKQLEAEASQEDASTDQTVEKVSKATANPTMESEDTETLESIYKEVERLVADKQLNNQSQMQAIKDLEEGTQEPNPKNTEESSSSAIKLNSATEQATEEASEQKTVSNIAEDSKKADTEAGDVHMKVGILEDTKLVEQAAGNNVGETAEDVKKDKCHFQAGITSNSVRSSKVSASPVSEDTSSEGRKNIVDDVVTKDDKCQRDDSADNNNTVNNVTEKKVTVTNNTEQSDVSKEVSRDEGGKSEAEVAIAVDEQMKSANDENKKRVLRVRDKTKKSDKAHAPCAKESGAKISTEDEVVSLNNARNEEDSEEKRPSQEPNASEDQDDAPNSGELDTNDAERQARTRRSRDAKKRREEQLASLKSKRPRREIRKSEQQNKEETLLDNEVAKINENNRSFLGKYENGTESATNFRGFSEGGRGSLGKRQDSKDNVRSKSENDLTIAKEPTKTGCETRLSRNLSENHMGKQQTENIDTDILDADCKPVKTPETSQKDSDDSSTSGESSSSVNVTPKILETPEDKAKKESILRLLGLESLEKAAERLSHQKAKKEQYTGTLKTVIRVQKEKEKEKDKRRSRSPLKMVLKQGRGDGDGDSPENFYTIQKEFGTSGWGDSSSGANRKFSTNHRHSCDEDNEDSAPKDRQSLVIPEKSSSFSIHPGRLCADVCCYCFGKFGSLDTPMHLAQMKSDERRKKILNIERHLTKDSCLCDACYRHVDRKANTSPTNMQAKPQKQHRQLMVSKCSARDCRDAARHHVKRRWLLKIKAGLQKQVDIDWESSQHTSMSFCVGHYSKIERFLTCALCKRRLARNHTHQLGSAETDELNQLLGQQGIPVVVAAGTFVCKLCRYFTQLQLKYKDVENMNTNHRSFFKSYRKRILHYHDIEVLENEDEDPAQNQTKDGVKEKEKEKEKRKKARCTNPAKSGPSSKSPDVATNSASEKSTPEPSKTEGGANSETDNENRAEKGNDDNMAAAAAADVQFLGIESAVEKLKKRKLLDMHPYTTSDTASLPSLDNASEVVEILAMDKEVTLTRLPKRPRASNDITPVVQRLGANPSISVRTLFPGEEEMNLHANIEFANVREITPQGWEKCATMIQYDRDTKLLWQELQRPYGNQSSFLRHLILLEKYYRSGDLVLAPNASRNAINYSTSVQNRLISYEGPEKMDEPIMEPIALEYHNSRRLSGGYVLERDKHTLPGTSTPKQTASTNNNNNSNNNNNNNNSHATKGSPPRVLKLNAGVSIIKKPPPSLQRLNLPSTSTTSGNATTNGNVRRKDSGQKAGATSGGGKVFQLSEPDFKRLQSLKKQKQQMLTEKQLIGSSSPPNLKSTTATQYQKAQMAAHTQFQKHLRMQQEMLSRQSRSDFEPLICDVRALANENSPTQNLLHNLNLPKSIQVTTKTSSSQIPILPKIPKSLTVIPQTVTRPAEK